MTDGELAWANQRLAGATVADPAGLPAVDRLGPADPPAAAATAGAFLRRALAARLSRSPYRRYVAAHPPAAPTRPWPGELRQIPPLRRY
jgi:hypothetical protein